MGLLDRLEAVRNQVVPDAPLPGVPESATGTHTVVAAPVPVPDTTGTTCDFLGISMALNQLLASGLVQPLTMDLFMVLSDILGIRTGMLLYASEGRMVPAFTAGFDMTSRRNLALSCKALGSAPSSWDLKPPSDLGDLLSGQFSFRNEWLSGQTFLVVHRHLGEAKSGLLLSDSAFQLMSRVEQEQTAMLVSLILSRWYQPGIREQAELPENSGHSAVLDLDAPVFQDVFSQFHLAPSFLEILLTWKSGSLLASIPHRISLQDNHMIIQNRMSRKELESGLLPILSRELSLFLDMEADSLPLTCQGPLHDM